MTQEPEAHAAPSRWRARPLLALLVRAFLLLVPLAASGAAVLAVDRAAPAAPDRPWHWVTLALAAAVVTGVVVERGTRRLLPLPVLLRLDLLFPDRAPSRYRVAREAVARSQRRLTDSPAGRAEQVMRLIGALGAHDRRTRGHCERVRVLTDLLANELGLPEADRDRLRWAALLHDLGKLDVPLELLTKPTRLSPTEFATVRSHPEVGASLAAPLLPWLGEWGRGILEHHEKYDGSGYPAGLTGSGISRAGRMVGLVDAFETMTAARSYKKAMATAAARAELARCSGTHFDPTCVRAFLAVPLPRLLWAMGPTAFLLQVPFLRMLAEAGRLSGSAGAVAGPAAAGLAGAAALVVSGVGATALSPAPGAPLTVDGPATGPTAQAGAQPVAFVRAAAAPAAPDVDRPASPLGPPTGLAPEPPAPPAPDATGSPVAPVGPPTGLAPEPAPLPPMQPLEPAPGPLLDPLPDGRVPELDPVAGEAESALESTQPVIETTDPVLDDTEPVLETPPILDTTQPILDTTQPILDATEPVLDTTQPVVDAIDPVLDTTEPVLDITQPVLDTTQPVLDALDPVLDSTEPVLDTTQPVVDAVDRSLTVGGALDI